MGIETVFNRQAIITGGTDITDKVIEQLKQKIVKIGLIRKNGV